MNKRHRFRYSLVLGWCLLPMLSCTPFKKTGETLTLSEEVLISTNFESILKCEPSVAITENVIVAAWNDSYGGMKSGRVPGVAVGWAMSLDQGKSFEFGGYLPEFERKESFMGADAWFQTDDRGDIYLNILGWGTEESRMDLYLMPATDPGTWARIASPMILSKEYGIIDRPHMFLHGPERLWISYSEHLKKDGIKRMRLIGSTDKGRTWSPPLTLSEPVKKIRGGGIPIACIGDHILAVWKEGEELGRIDELWYALSRDGGDTFSRARMLRRLESGQDLSPEGYNIGQGLGPISMDLTPVLGVVSKEADDGHFFLTVVDTTDTGSRLLHYDFDPDSEEFILQDSLSSSPDSVLKMLPAVPSRFKYPALLYYDRRNDLAHETLTDLYLNIRTDNNLLETRLNTVGSRWSDTRGDKDHAPMQRNFGDYITLASHGNRLFAVWTDGREGFPRIFGRLIEID